MNQESKKQIEQENHLLLGTNDLNQKMIQYLSPIYFLKSLEIDDIDTLVSNEFFRVRNILCRIYKFDENKHISESDGTSPFDAIRNDIEQEVYKRIYNDPDFLTIINIRKKYIMLIRVAVKSNNNIIGTFYKNQGKHYRDGEITGEYDTSPIVVIQNSDYFGYGGYEANTVYELFINDVGELFCVLYGETGEAFNEPVEHVHTEGLIEITHWLAEQGFISSDKFIKIKN